MAILETTVVYEVAAAVQNMKKLAEQSTSLSKTGVKAFRAINTSVLVLNNTLPRLPKSVEGVRTGFKNTAKAAARLSIGLVGIAVAAPLAVAAVATLAVQFIKLPGLIGSATRSLEAFREGTGRVLDAQELISAQQDARINAAFRNQAIQLELQEAQTADIQVNSAKRLKILEKERQAIIGAATESERLQQKLEGRIASRGDGVGSQNADIKAASLLEKATLQARKGNVALAEQLITQAEALIPKLENASFFTSAREDSEKEIDKALGSQIKKLKVVEERTKQEQELSELAASQGPQQGAAQKRIKIGAERAKDEQAIASASRKSAKALTDLNAEFTKGESTARNLWDSFRQNINVITAFKEQVQASVSQRQTFSQARVISEGIAAERRGEITSGELTDLFEKRLIPLIAQDAATQNIIETNDLEGFSTSQGKTGRIIDSLVEAAEAHEAAAAAQLSRAQNLREDVVPTREAGPVAQRALEQSARDTVLNVNVQADVKGVIDDETIEAISDKVGRVLRQKTGNGF